MGKIRIVRSNQWLNRNSKFKVMVNGQQLGIVANGETQDYDVIDKSNSLKIKMDWSVNGSEELSLQVTENEIKTFNVCVNKKIYYLTSANFFVLIVNFILVRFFDYKDFILFILPVVVVYLYYFTLGRNKYLVLKEA